MTSSAKLLDLADSFFVLGAELFFLASDSQLYWLTGLYFHIGTLGTCLGRQISKSASAGSKRKVPTIGRETHAKVYLSKLLSVFFLLFKIS